MAEPRVNSAPRYVNPVYPAVTEESKQSVMDSPLVEDFFEYCRDNHTSLDKDPRLNSLYEHKPPSFTVTQSPVGIEHRSYTLIYENSKNFYYCEAKVTPALGDAIFTSGLIFSGDSELAMTKMPSGGTVFTSAADACLVGVKLGLSESKLGCEEDPLVNPMANLWKEAKESVSWVPVFGLYFLAKIPFTGGKRAGPALVRYIVQETIAYRKFLRFNVHPKAFIPDTGPFFATAGLSVFAARGYVAIRNLYEKLNPPDTKESEGKRSNMAFWVEMFAWLGLAKLHNYLSAVNPITKKPIPIRRLWRLRMSRVNGPWIYVWLAGLGSWGLEKYMVDNDYDVLLRHLVTQKVRGNPSSSLGKAWNYAGDFFIDLFGMRGATETTNMWEYSEYVKEIREEHLNAAEKTADAMGKQLRETLPNLWNKESNVYDFSKIMYTSAKDSFGYSIQFLHIMGTEYPKHSWVDDYFNVNPQWNSVTLKEDADLYQLLTKLWGPEENWPQREFVKRSLDPKNIEEAKKREYAALEIGHHSGLDM